LVKSVNICRKSSLVENEKYWRNAFVTFSSEKDALYAKISLSEDRDSVWYGQLSFAKSKTLCNNKSCVKEELSLPRTVSELPSMPGNVLFLAASCQTSSSMLPRDELEKIMSRFGDILDVTIGPKLRNATVTFAEKEDALRALKFFQNRTSDVQATLGGHPKPTPQIYMHRVGNDPAMTNVANVEKTLGAMGFSKESWSAILVSKTNDYALVQFESVADAEDIFYTLKTFVSDEWVLDFEPLNVSCRRLALLSFPKTSVGPLHSTQHLLTLTWCAYRRRPISRNSFASTTRPTE
jgi:hypothetical protein